MPLIATTVPPSPPPPSPLSYQANAFESIATHERRNSFLFHHRLSFFLSFVRPTTAMHVCIALHWLLLLLFLLPHLASN
jgi:hypothetical protein